MAVLIHEFNVARGGIFRFNEVGNYPTAAEVRAGGRVFSWALATMRRPIAMMDDVGRTGWDAQLIQRDSSSHSSATTRAFKLNSLPGRELDL